MTQLVNCDATDSLVEMLTPDQLLLFGSTGSNYGKVPNGICTEETPLNPTSLYAETKTYAEKKAMSHGNTIAYRFATAFGVSPRMRFDLTVNEFTKEMALGNELVIYDANTWRPYCHTEDFAYLICKVIEADIAKIAFEIFNVGDNENNFTKQMIVDEILKFYPNGKVKYLEKGVDQRNYIVDFSKVNSVLNFKPKYSISKGVNELILQINDKKFDFKSENQFGNYNLNL